MPTLPLILKKLETPRPVLGGVILIAALVGAVVLTIVDGVFATRAWPLVAGMMFGVAVQRGELSLVRAWRDFLALKNSGQLLGFLSAMFVAQVATLGFLILSDAAAPPRDARIAPVSWLLPPAAILFGSGCVIARGGIMVHMRRLAEGSLVSIPALLAVLAGCMIGIVLWPWTWTHAIEGAAYPWLPATFGFEGSLALQIVALGILAALLWSRRPRRKGRRLGVARRVLVEPWPATVAGSIVGLVVALCYAGNDPFGLVAECAIVARRIAEVVGLVPVELPALADGVGGFTAPKMRPFGLHDHIALLLGVLAAAFASAVSSGRFSITTFSVQEGVEMLVGGLMVGLGVMLSLGAVIGEAIAGVAVGAASGWIFLLFASLGIIVTLKLDPRDEMMKAGDSPKSAGSPVSAPSPANVSNSAAGGANPA